MLCGTAAHLECAVAGTNDVGTHTIFVGRVIRAASSGRAPLLHHDGRYATLA